LHHHIAPDDATLSGFMNGLFVHLGYYIVPVNGNDQPLTAPSNTVTFAAG
jgi:hypothetical protein